MIEEARKDRGRSGTRPESPIQTYLAKLHARFANLEEGHVATYIPELAKADPRWFGICLATVDGMLYEVGDTQQPFTIQSISKPFTYGLALEDRGQAAVGAKIGVEPTGDAFNSISLAAETGCPLNPMINAGAIAAASLVAGYSPADKLERLTSVFSLYAGRRLSVDQAVYESERDTGHRNRAIGHMLRNFDILTEDPNEALDLYFQQCSLTIDCRDLAWMGATLANRGVHPTSGERAVREELVESILTVMATCGMYDYSGEWLYTVGLPAKSGVGGGVLAILPGQLAIAVFSPPLDGHGNSVRGIAVCRQLSSDWNLHFLHTPSVSRAVMRTSYSLAAIGSRRRRSADERALLDQHGGRARVYELQGDLGFAALEAIVRAIVRDRPDMNCAILDLKRVTRIAGCGVAMLGDLIRCSDGDRLQLLFANAEGQPRFLRALEESLVGSDDLARLRRFSDLDSALEWCENRLLSSLKPATEDVAMALEEHAILRGLASSELKHLDEILERRCFAPGEFILRRGQPGDSLCFLLRGRVSVTTDLANGRTARLSTLSPGMVFGELAVIDRSPRTADVRADTVVECAVLSTVDLDRLGRSLPSIKVKLLENLLANVARTVARLNFEIGELLR